MGQARPGEVTERFRPTSGQATGVLALVAAVGTVVLGLVDDFPAPLIAGAVLVGVLAWAALLKPRVAVADRRLVLRNMFETVSIPLAAVEGLAVRQVLAVRVGEKRYVSAAVGRTLRSTLGAGGRPAPGEELAARMDPGYAEVTARRSPAYVDVVEARIRQLVEEDRARRGIRRGSAEADALAAEVRRTPAWLEIGLLAAAVVGLVATIVL